MSVRPCRGSLLWLTVGCGLLVVGCSGYNCDKIAAVSYNGANLTVGAAGYQVSRPPLAAQNDNQRKRPVVLTIASTAATGGFTAGSQLCVTVGSCCSTAVTMLAASRAGRVLGWHHACTVVCAVVPPTRRHQGLT